MGFLDNSGDIILDAVLTDLGRKKLAAGDGSFRIVKFALSDEEIDYSQYDKAQPTGQQDLDILASPVFEAFTNNTSTMKSLLLSIPRTDLLFLPILKINTETADKGGSKYSDSTLINNGFAISVNTTTNTQETFKNKEAILFTSVSNIKTINIDQGIDAADTSVPTTSTLASIFPELVETQFMIEIDNRLGTLIDSTGASITPSFIDDDNIATYVVTDNKFVNAINLPETNSTITKTILQGSPGNKLIFSVKASANLQSSDTLFNLLGSSVTISSATYKRIFANITVTGMTTGYSIEVPVAFYKHISG
jgi:hypothetical protein